jgi:hypothetical protein
MPKLSSAQTARYYARLGAEAKVRDLKEQIAAILAVFPEIAATESLSRGARPSAGPSPQRRKRKPMSAAARTAVGERIRKYWARRRKAKSA